MGGKSNKAMDIISSLKGMAVITQESILQNSISAKKKIYFE
jgi:hypothetical protein